LAGALASYRQALGIRERLARQDPGLFELASPGTGREGLASLAGYMLRPGSPCLGAGIPIAGNGGRDFWGNPVALPPAIGVHERTRN